MRNSGSLFHRRFRMWKSVGVTAIAATAIALAPAGAAQAGGQPSTPCQSAGTGRVICSTGWIGFPGNGSIQWAGIHHNWNYPIAFYILYNGANDYVRICVPNGTTVWEDSSAYSATMNIPTGSWGYGLPERC